MCKQSDMEDLEIKTESGVETYNEFKEIKDFRKEISKMNIFNRKKIAEEEYKKYLINKNIIADDRIIIEEDIIKSEYIKILYFVLIDNTNQKIVKTYLKFIKKYHDFIKKHNLKPYEKELKKYKVIFQKEEINEIENDIKDKSQKDIFLEYIDYISDLDLEKNFDKLDFLKETKKKLNQLFLFNMPIEFDNQELYYYKLYYNLLNQFANQDIDEIIDFLKNKKNVINYIKKKDLFNAEYIISNEDKSNLLFLYLLYEKFPKNYDENNLINFNRLIQSMPVNEKDFNLINKENDINKLIKIDNIDTILHKYNPKQKETICIELKKVCLKNLFNPKLNRQTIVTYYYNIEALLEDNEISPYISLIKEFLIKFIDTNVYKEAIKILFPEYFMCLNSNNNEEIKYYINNRIKFYPFQDLELSGNTDKLSCYSYIPTVNFKTHTEDLKIENHDTYKVGLTIVNSMHEINHANQDIIFFKGNNKNLLYFPERIIGVNKYNNDITSKEGGISFEYILFGQMIFNIDLLQSLYILNEKNYEQSLNNFRKNFQNIREIVKNTNGKTPFIQIDDDGIFKGFYADSKDELEGIIEKLKIKSNHIISKMNIEKRNVILDDDYYVPPKKCGIMKNRRKKNNFNIKKK